MWPSRWRWEDYRASLGGSDLVSGMERAESCRVIDGHPARNANTGAEVRGDLGTDAALKGRSSTVDPAGSSGPSFGML